MKVFFQFSTSEHYLSRDSSLDKSAAPERQLQGVRKTLSLGKRQITTTPFLTRSQPKYKPDRVHLWGPVSLLGLQRMGEAAGGVHVAQSSCTRKSQPSMDDGFPIATEREGATLNLLQSTDSITSRTPTPILPTSLYN